MDNQNSPLGDGEKELLSKIGLTIERSNEISAHVKGLFNNGDSWTSDNINVLAKTYKGTELVFASMGFHNLLMQWEQRCLAQAIFGKDPSQ